MINNANDKLALKRSVSLIACLHVRWFYIALTQFNIYKSMDTPFELEKDIDLEKIIVKASDEGKYD